ncbi:MAG TPA: phenylalanine--tRNA ligase subunit beta [bacterium (Candidatus Stahlbacteria)]|nr:phenylalanine--tRNA ligase subunit beta [Candidatus Stahlbacteria bacterium]
MKISVEWIRELIPEVEVEELLDLLPRLGLGVEEVIESRQERILTGRVEGTRNHPKRKDLLVLEIFADRPYKVVTGASNMKVGDIVLLGLPGATVSGKHIDVSEFDGVRSEGMLISEEEIGISESSTGIIILDPETPVGKKFDDLFDRVILDLEVTPNRGDCESILGIAREIAVLRREKGKLIDLKPPRLKSGPEIKVQSSADCPRYTGMIIEDVNVTESPFKIKWRLFHHGIRPINSIVDITNYVMLLLGQPLHAFDLELLKGSIQVRRGRTGEEMVTLDGTEVRLTNEHLIIADKEGPIAIAGVIGGKKAEISERTNRILLESATFNPEVVRKATRGLMIDTQSGQRFERGTDPRMPPLAARYAGEMIKGRPVSFSDIKTRIKDRRIRFDPGRISRYLGVRIKRKELTEILAALNFQPRNANGRVLITVPSYRRDIEHECDIAEEVARVYGYDRIPMKLSRGEKTGRLPLELKIIRRLRSLLVALGFYECHTYSPISQDMVDLFGIGPCIRIKNPLNERFTHLRSSLAPSLVEILAHNYRNGNTDVRIFTIGKVFRPSDPKDEESTSLGIIGGGRIAPIHWDLAERDWDIFDMKGILETISKSLNVTGMSLVQEKIAMFDSPVGAIILSGHRIGAMGAISEEILTRFDIRDRYFFSEINLDQLILRMAPPIYIPYPKVPKVRRDLAFIVRDSIPVQDMIDRIKKIGGPILSEVLIFDRYRGEGIPEGMVSIGFRLTLQPEERTLTDAEIKGLIDKIVFEIEKGFSARLRDKEVRIGRTQDPGREDR